VRCLLPNAEQRANAEGLIFPLGEYCERKRNQNRCEDSEYRGDILQAAAPMTTPIAPPRPRLIAANSMMGSLVAVNSDALPDQYEGFREQRDQVSHELGNDHCPTKKQNVKARAATEGIKTRGRGVITIQNAIN